MTAKSKALAQIADMVLKGTVTQADVLTILHDVSDKYPAHAADIEQTDELEVDHEPLYSLSEDGGVWVSAWVFVRDPE